MRITCAWCQQEGRPADLGEREPLDDPTETHGICTRHRRQLLGELASRPSRGVQLLLIVSPNESRLYEDLQRELADVSGVRVILDRRRGERRVASQNVNDEQRRAQRRVRRGEVSALGYSAIRLGPPA